MPKNSVFEINVLNHFVTVGKYNIPTWLQKGDIGGIVMPANLEILSHFFA